jgi:hypothetical protein
MTPEDAARSPEYAPPLGEPSEPRLPIGPRLMLVATVLLIAFGAVILQMLRNRNGY